MSEFGDGFDSQFSTVWSKKSVFHKSENSITKIEEEKQRKKKALTFIKNDLVATLRAHFHCLIQKQEHDYQKRKIEGQNLRSRKRNWEIKEMRIEKLGRELRALSLKRETGEVGFSFLIGFNFEFKWMNMRAVRLT